MMHLIDRKRDMAKVMAEANATWAGAESFIENQDGASNFVSKVGSGEGSLFMGEAVIWTIAIGNVLVSERGAVPKAEVLARMPPAEKVAEWVSMQNGAWSFFASPLLVT